MKAYVISLHNPQNLVCQLSDLGFDPELVPGVNGSELSHNDLKQQCTPVYSPLGPKSAVGCAMSHINVWKRIADDKQNEHAAIFEDDVIFVDDFKWRWQRVDTTQPFDVLYLGCFNSPFFRTIFSLLGMTTRNYKESPQHPNKSCVYTPKVALGTHAYVLSRRGAKKLLDHLQHKIYNHIDFSIQSLASRGILHTLAVHPRLVYQTSTFAASSSLNVQSRHPLLINLLVQNIGLDECVTADYILNLSIVRLGNTGVHINIWSLVFLFAGLVLAKSGATFPQLSIMFIILSILDNVSLQLLFHFLLFVFVFVSNINLLM